MRIRIPIGCRKQAYTRYYFIIPYFFSMVEGWGCWGVDNEVSTTCIHYGSTRPSASSNPGSDTSVVIISVTEEEIIVSVKES
jgi:hypothetical protein